MKKPSVIRALLFTVATVIATPVLASSIALNPDDYGHLNQDSPVLAGVCTAGGVSYACGPVAAVNSFIFLQNRYPGIYDNALIDPNAAGTAAALAALMGCLACAGGTNIADFIAGKMRYIEGKVPGKTTYASMQNPDFAFLSHEIQHGEDVELLIGFYDVTGTRVGGHYVTLYDITDAAGGMTLSFVDPSAGAGAGLMGALNMQLGYMINPGGIIQLNNYNGRPAGSTPRIDWAVSESPIPEPATLILLLWGTPVVIWRLRRSERSAQNN